MWRWIDTANLTFGEPPPLQPLPHGRHGPRSTPLRIARHTEAAIVHRVVDAGAGCAHLIWLVHTHVIA